MLIGLRPTMSHNLPSCSAPLWHRFLNSTLVASTELSAVESYIELTMCSWYLRVQQHDPAYD